MRTILLLLLALPAAAQEDSSNWDARVTAVEGEVRLFPAGREEGVPAEEGDALSPGDRLETGPDSRAEIALDPDSVLSLGPGAVFTLESLDRSESSFSLLLGTLAAKLKALLSDARLEVRTPDAVAAVRGTEFGVEVPEDGETVIGVFDEGSVAVRPREEGAFEETLVTRNREVRLPRGPDARGPLRLRRLSRLKAQRGRIVRLRERRAELRRSWRALPRQARRELRRRMDERRLRMREPLRPRQDLRRGGPGRQGRQDRSGPERRPGQRLGQPGRRGQPGGQQRRPRRQGPGRRPGPR